MCDHFTMPHRKCQIFSRNLRYKCMERFGAKLRTLRERRGISLRQLTREFGFNSHSYLSGIENGKTKPSVEFVIRVADFFEVDINKLVRDELELD